MKIYFDGTLVNEDYYMDITKSAIMFDKTFKMGVSACRNYTIKVNKNAITGPIDVITIYQTVSNQDVLKDTLRVISIEDIDNYTSIIYAEDNMTLFNIKYDLRQRFPNQTTYNTGDVFDDILSMLNITVRPGLIINIKRNINFQNPGLNLMARDFLQMIGEVSLVNFFIDENGYLVLRDLESNYASSFTTDISEYRIGTRHKITRVVFDGNNSWTYGDTTGETYYINPNNVCIQQASDVEAIYNKIKNKVYYDIQLKNAELINDVLLGTYRSIQLNNETYYFYYQYQDAVYCQDDNEGKWIGTVKVQLENERQQETEIIGIPTDLIELKRTVDYDSGRIDQVIINKVGNDEVISKINQSAEQIEISANKVDLQGYVTFTNLQTAGQTTINGGNITTGSINCDLLNGGTINGQTINGGNITGTDITCSNTLYVGSNQEASTNDTKKIQLSSDAYISRTKNYGITSTELNSYELILKANGNEVFKGEPGNTYIKNNYGQEININGSSGWIETTELKPSYIDAGNIDCGQGYCSSSGATYISFNKTFSSPPIVVATPYTSTTGVIALKIDSITSTGFTITIGGSSFPNNELFNWIAIGDI